MTKWHIYLINIIFGVLPLIVFLIIFVPILKSGYEITDDTYHYTLSTIPQTIATLVGLFAIFSIYIIQGLKKRNRENELKGVYFWWCPIFRDLYT